ncbi:hypothetical protein [Halioxenophilus sp. WMMB6]|uniref:hypothetical protein n=1 Tax=Halioxenophilus sp. WMMB6 TaxID=3073815 RepID=UPI00295E3EE8|nr:hypothetical protein [Halioxenophilus sp. WMMB6]
MGLFAGIELVSNRATKEPVPESIAITIAGECTKRGLLIGRTNRSFDNFNNTLCLSPALIAGRSDIEEIVAILEDVFSSIKLP